MFVLTNRLVSQVYTYIYIHTEKLLLWYFVTSISMLTLGLFSGFRLVRPGSFTIIWFSDMPWRNRQSRSLDACSVGNVSTYSRSKCAFSPWISSILGICMHVHTHTPTNTLTYGYKYHRKEDGVALMKFRKYEHILVIFFF